MSRHAGFVPAARFEVASETDSFREGRDASDGDGVGGSQDAIPLPRPTSGPAAVLSGEPNPPADFGDGRRGRSHLAPTHPSSAVPRWQTHLTPMQQWELRLRDTASRRDARASPERHLRDVAKHPWFALQRQHEHARRRRAKDGSSQTLDTPERAEGRERAGSSFAGDEEVRFRSVPVSPACLSNPENGRSRTTVDVHPGPDPFVSPFAAVARVGDDAGDVELSAPSKASSKASSASSPRFPDADVRPPFLDAHVARVPRPKGSALADLSVVDAPWDGRGVAGAAERDGRADAETSVGVGAASGSSRRAASSTPTRPRSARRFLERRLSRTRASQARVGAFDAQARPELGSRGAPPRADSDEAPPLDLKRVEAFGSASAASSARAKDVATFRDAGKAAADAIAAASSAVASEMDDLIDALRVRDLTIAIQTDRRTDAERAKVRDATARVAAAHASATSRFAETGDASSLRVFDAATALAVSECMDDVMNATRWWYGTRVRVAATTIQAGFRGMRGRKLARARRRGALARRAALRDFTKKVRFRRWRENAVRLRRLATFAATRDRKRAWSRRARAFEAWRTRTHLSKRFHAEVERLARNMRVKFHRAPAFAAWRAVAATRARQRTVAAELRRNAQRRSREYAFAAWAETAAACVRARVLDTAAHARAAARAVEAFEETEVIAAAAWAAAAEAGRCAKSGSFVDARRFAERARALRDEARATCAAAEQHALESGPDAGPKSRARRAYAAFAAAKESSLRADGAAAAAERAADFTRAARLFRGRVLSRRAIKAWSAYVAWLVHLREKARKAAHFSRRSTCGSAFRAWKGEAARAKAAREAAAIRAYADIHRRLVAKHVRDARVLGAPGGVPRRNRR